MQIFRAAWAVYGVVLFLLMMLLSIPVLLFNMILAPGKKALRNNIWYLHHPFSRTFFMLIGVRIKVEGLEHIDRKQSYVIVSNHRSSLDFIANAVVFPGIFRFLAKQELQKIPIFGWVVKKMCLTVDRKSAISRARSVIAMKKELEEGVSVFIYPEGSRNKTGGPLNEFFDGAFRIAVETKAPILPMTIINMDRICDGNKLDLGPGVLHIRFDEPIPTAPLTSANVPELKKQVWNLLHDRFTAGL